MTYDVVTYQPTGTQTIFTFPFDYINKTYVKATLNGVALSYGIDYEVNGNEITFTNAPDGLLTIFRETPTDRLVEWNEGSVFLASDLTLAQIQQLHIIEETQVWAKANVLSEDEITKEWQGRFKRIINILDPVDPQDAVTLAYMQSTQNGYIQDVTNLKNQTAQYADNAKASAQSATASALSASTSEQRANTHLNTVKTYATTANNHATKAKASEDNAQKYAQEAKYASENVNIFTPYYDDEGNLCFKNKVGLENPAPRPIRMIIKGKFETEEELMATYPVGEIGDYYTANNHLYTWYGDTWVNVGSLVANNTTPLVHIVSERERTENEPTYGLETGIIELEQATFLVDVDGTLHEVESKNIYLKENDE